MNPVDCAWCGKEMKPGNRKLPVSHGCCPDCMAKLLEVLTVTPLPCELPDGDEIVLAE